MAIVVKGRTYTNSFESIRTMAKLLAPSDLTWVTELPLKAAHAPLILHISCNVHYTLFIPYIAQQILKLLNLEFITLGGPENCCGGIHQHIGPPDLEHEVATKSLLVFRRAQPKIVLSGCPQCDEGFGKHQVKGSPIRYSNVAELFVEHLNALKERMRPVARRIVVHFHDFNESRQRDSQRILTILSAIPGIEILPAQHTRGPGIHCSQYELMSPDDTAKMFAENKYRDYLELVDRIEFLL
mgnify:CR=1 FL=1